MANRLFIYSKVPNDGPPVVIYAMVSHNKQRVLLNRIKLSPDRRNHGISTKFTSGEGQFVLCPMDHSIFLSDVNAPRPAKCSRQHALVRDRPRVPRGHPGVKIPCPGSSGQWRGKSRGQTGRQGVPWDLHDRQPRRASERIHSKVCKEG